MPKLNMDSDFATEPVLVEETYPAVLKAVNEYEKVYAEGPVKKLAWVFEVTATEEDVDDDHEYETEFTGTIEVAAHTTYATSEKSNFYKYGLGKFAGEDWDGDTDSLIGRSCLVDVEQYKDANGQTRNGVGKVKPPKKGKGKAASKKEPVEIDESDFEDIPL